MDLRIKHPTLANVESSIDGSLFVGGAKRAGGKARNGYWYTTVGGCVYAVHRLVLECHSQRREPDMITRHLNDDPDDNHPANLEWGTHQQNAEDRVRNSKQRWSGRVLTDQDVEDIRSLAARGKSHYEIADIYPVSRRHITRIVRKQRCGGGVRKN